MKMSILAGESNYIQHSGKEILSIMTPNLFLEYAGEQWSFGLFGIIAEYGKKSVDWLYNSSKLKLFWKRRGMLIGQDIGFKQA